MSPTPLFSAIEIAFMECICSFKVGSTASSHFILQIMLWAQCHYPHFILEKTEVYPHPAPSYHTTFLRLLNKYQPMAIVPTKCFCFLGGGIFAKHSLCFKNVFPSRQLHDFWHLSKAWRVHLRLFGGPGMRVGTRSGAGQCSPTRN